MKAFSAIFQRMHLQRSRSETTQFHLKQSLPELLDQRHFQTASVSGISRQFDLKIGPNCQMRNYIQYKALTRKIKVLNNSKESLYMFSVFQLFVTPRTVDSQALHPWDSPGKNAGLGSHSLLQGISPIQGVNMGLPHSRQILSHLSHQEIEPGEVQMQKGYELRSRRKKNL